MGKRKRSKKKVQKNEENHITGQENESGDAPQPSETELCVNQIECPQDGNVDNDAAGSTENPENDALRKSKRLRKCATPSDPTPGGIDDKEQPTGEHHVEENPTESSQSPRLVVSPNVVQHVMPVEPSPRRRIMSLRQGNIISRMAPPRHSPAPKNNSDVFSRVTNDDDTPRTGDKSPATKENNFPPAMSQSPVSGIGKVVPPVRPSPGRRIMSFHSSNSSRIAPPRSVSTPLKSPSAIFTRDLTGYAKTSPIQENSSPELKERSLEWTISQQNEDTRSNKDENMNNDLVHKDDNSVADETKDTCSVNSKHANDQEVPDMSDTEKEEKEWKGVVIESECGSTTMNKRQTSTTNERKKSSKKRKISTEKADEMRRARNRMLISRQKELAMKRNRLKRKQQIASGMFRRLSLDERNSKREETCAYRKFKMQEFREIEIRLHEVHLQFVESLNINSPNVDGTVQALENFYNLSLTPYLVKKHPEMVLDIMQTCKHADEKVKKASQRAMNRVTPMFPMKESQEFIDAFLDRVNIHIQDVYESHIIHEFKKEQATQTTESTDVPDEVQVDTSTTIPQTAVIANLDMMPKRQHRWGYTAHDDDNEAESDKSDDEMSTSYAASSSVITENPKYFGKCLELDLETQLNILSSVMGFRVDSTGSDVQLCSDIGSEHGNETGGETDTDDDHVPDISEEHITKVTKHTFRPRKPQLSYAEEDSCDEIAHSLSSDDRPEFNCYTKENATEISEKTASTVSVVEHVHIEQSVTGITQDTEQNSRGRSRNVKRNEAVPTRRKTNRCVRGHRASTPENDSKEQTPAGGKDDIEQISPTREGADSAKAAEANKKSVRQPTTQKKKRGQFKPPQTKNTLGKRIPSTTDEESVKSTTNNEQEKPSMEDGEHQTSESLDKFHDTHNQTDNLDDNTATNMSEVKEDDPEKSSRNTPARTSRRKHTTALKRLAENGYVGDDTNSQADNVASDDTPSISHEVTSKVQAEKQVTSSRRCMRTRHTKHNARSENTDMKTESSEEDHPGEDSTELNGEFIELPCPKHMAVKSESDNDENTKTEALSSVEGFNEETQREEISTQKPTETKSQVTSRRNSQRKSCSLPNSPEIRSSVTQLDEPYTKEKRNKTGSLKTLEATCKRQSVSLPSSPMHNTRSANLKMEESSDDLLGNRRKRSVKKGVHSALPDASDACDVENSSQNSDISVEQKSSPSIVGYIKSLGAMIGNRWGLRGNRNGGTGTRADE